MAGSVGQSMSFSMRTTVYAIKKKFPSVRNISCQELEQWKQQGKNLVCLVIVSGHDLLLMTGIAGHSPCR